MWIKHDGSKVRGLKIEGDKTVRPTTKFNIAWMKFFGWKMVVVFTLSEADAKNGYRLGYRSHDGTCRVNSTIRHDQMIAMRVGHEDCTFFALSPDGDEITFTWHGTTLKSRAKKFGIRLV